MGNVPGTAPIDPAKPFQDQYNIQVQRIQETQAADFGKVLSLVMAYKPKSMSIPEYIKMMKYGKLALIDTSNEDVRSVDPQLFKVLDFGSLDKLGPQLQYLEYLYNQAALAMCYNTSRLGTASPYTTVTNNQQNIVQSTHQTEDLYSIHNKIVERFMRQFLRAAKVVFKGDPLLASRILDDDSRINIEIDWEVMDSAEIGVVMRNSTEDFQNLETIKGQAQQLFGQGLMSFTDFAKLYWSKNGAELLNIAEASEDKKQKEVEAQREHEERMMQAQQQAMEEDRIKREEFELKKQANELETRRYIADQDTMKFARQMDINEDGIHDSIERAIIDNDAKKEIEFAKLKQDLQKHKDEIAILKEKMKIERIKATSKTKT
jgi:hypothetical protein